MSRSLKPIFVLEDLLACEREGKEIAIHIPLGSAKRRVETVISELFADELIRQTWGTLLQLMDFFASVADRPDPTPRAPLHSPILPQMQVRKTQPY